jgi:hypothetical protein
MDWKEGRMNRAAIVAAYADPAKSLRDVARLFGTTKSIVHHIINVDAPHLLGQTKCAKKKLDLDEVKRLTLLKLSRAEIATRLNYGYDAIRLAQVELGLHKTRAYKRQPPPVSGESEPALGLMIGSWPADLHFTSLRMKPAQVRSPQSQQTQSYVSCGTLLCSEGM